MAMSRRTGRQTHRRTDAQTVMMIVFDGHSKFKRCPLPNFGPRTNTYLGPLVAEISHGGFRLLGRCCVVFCCWLSIPKNTFILAAQREIFLKTEWLTPHAATENHSFCFITNWNVMLDTASLPGFLSGWYLSKRALKTRGLDSKKHSFQQEMPSGRRKRFSSGSAEGWENMRKSIFLFFVLPIFLVVHWKFPHQIHSGSLSERMKQPMTKIQIQLPRSVAKTCKRFWPLGACAHSEKGWRVPALLGMIPLQLQLWTSLAAAVWLWPSCSNYHRCHHHWRSCEYCVNIVWIFCKGM